MPLIDRGARLALATFAAVALVAFFVVLHAARSQWFFLDEWDFLAGRTAWNLGDLFRPHNDAHWQTLPVLTYRLGWWLFGLRDYQPYLALVLLTHIAIAGLLRVVMRRAGVGPWIATAAASLFLLLGSGHEDMAWAFQIGFNGSLAFGLTQLLLADHDGKIERRDYLGLAAGTAGLMCSGIALTMVAVVGIAVRFRRGWRVASFHVVPLVAIFATWYAVIGHRGGQRSYRGSVVQDARFVVVGVQAGFRALGPEIGGGVALATILLVGLWLVLFSRAETEQPAPVLPLALLAGAVINLAISASGRSALGSAYARQSRYLYLFAALALPSLAIAAAWIARRWRVVGPAACALFLIGIPANLHVLFRFEQGQARSQRDYRTLMLSLPAVPLAGQVNPKIFPEHAASFPVTVGWLLAGKASGRIPTPRPFTEADRLRATLRLSLIQGATSLHHCTVINNSVERSLRTGERVGIRGGLVRVTLISEARFRSAPTTYNPKSFFGNTLIVDHGPITIEIQADSPRRPIATCI